MTPRPSQTPTDLLIQFHQPFSPQALVAGPLHLDTQRKRLTLTVPLAVIEDAIPGVGESDEELMHEVVEGWLGVRTWQRGLFIVTEVIAIGQPSPAPDKALPYLGQLASSPTQSRVLLAVKAWGPAR